MLRRSRRHRWRRNLSDWDTVGRQRRWFARASPWDGRQQLVGIEGSVCPKSASEYLALDAMAFPSREHSDARWPLPLAVFELEKQPAR